MGTFAGAVATLVRRYLDMLLLTLAWSVSGSDLETGFCRKAIICGFWAVLTDLYRENLACAFVCDESDSGIPDIAGDRRVFLNGYPYADRIELALLFLSHGAQRTDRSLGKHAETAVMQRRRSEGPDKRTV